MSSHSGPVDAGGALFEPGDRAPVQNLLAQHGIKVLNDAYADIVNRRAFREFSEILDAESVMRFAVAGRDPIEVVGPEAIAEFHDKVMKRFEFYVFSALSRTVELTEAVPGPAGDDAPAEDPPVPPTEAVPTGLSETTLTGAETYRSATGRVWMCEVRRDTGSLEWSTAYGLYEDRYLCCGGRWIFERRDYSTLTRTAGPVVPLPNRMRGHGS